MHLYSLTLNQATAINDAVRGSFSGPATTELVVAKGKILSLYRIEDDRIDLVYQEEVFGLIRSVMAFRVLGMEKDYIVVGSDSGRIVVIDFDANKNKFVKIIQESFGKTGCRRIVPGEYLAADPRGRVLMVGAVEKMKFFYQINRDSNNNLVISSPLEANKSRALCLAIREIDNGLDNPQFAAIEINYGDEDIPSSACVTGKAEKNLVYYEVDLALNHVVRKFAETLPSSAHHLISIPNGPGGEGAKGILVAYEDHIAYRNQGAQEITAKIPRRYDHSKKEGVFVTSSSGFFMADAGPYIFIQTEAGDIFQVELQYESEQVFNITVKYMDTIAPCTKFLVFESGHIFGAGDGADHVLYKITNLEDLDDVPFFAPRAVPKNLEPVDQLLNISNINDMTVRNLVGGNSSQIYLACGKGHKGTLRQLTQGLSVVEVGTNDMPFKPTRVLTAMAHKNDKFHKLMIVSSESQSLVLQLEEGNIVPVDDAMGFIKEEPTVHFCTLLDGSFLQVTSKSIMHVRNHLSPDHKNTKWDCEGKEIRRACSNQRQLVIQVDRDQLISFEYDEATGGKLVSRGQKIFKQEVKGIDMAEVPEQRIRFKFLVVVFKEMTVHVLSLEPDSCLKRVSLQALPLGPSDVSLTEMNGSLLLHIGLENGVLLRTTMDGINGVLSDSRSQYLGPHPVQLEKVRVKGQKAVLAMSNRPYLCYTYQNAHQVSPISYDALEQAASFSSEFCYQGIVGIIGDQLRIISIECLDDKFTQRVIKTQYSPTRLQVCSQNSLIYMIERDFNCYGATQREVLKQKLAVKHNCSEFADVDYSVVGNPKVGEQLTDQDIDGPNWTKTEKFASCLRIVDPVSFETLKLIEFEQGETVFSMYVSSLGQQGVSYLFLGMAENATLDRQCTSASIVTYRIEANGTDLTPLHKTPCEFIPSAFSESRGRLVCGVGNILRIFEMGQKKLLRKLDNRNLKSQIVQIRCEEDKIFVGDAQESVFALKFRPELGQLYIFADDVVNRWLTNFCMLDEDTVAGVDKFENFFINRLPLGSENDAEDDPAQTKQHLEKGNLNGAAAKMEKVCHFNIGEMGTCVQKCKLSASSSEVILFATSMGGIGAFMPFKTRQDVDFFVHLQMYLQVEFQPLCGRDHQSFRSSMEPAKDIIDGDLCEQFNLLDFSQQKAIADELSRAGTEVQKKLEMARNMI